MAALVSLAASLFMSLAGTPSLVAEDVIRAGGLVTPSNSRPAEGSEEAYLDDLFGREVTRTVYAGQEITMDNTRPPTVVKRNDVVTVKYIKGALEISTTGRALGNAAANEQVTILNLESRQTITGVVQAGGWVLAQ